MNDFFFPPNFFLYLHILHDGCGDVICIMKQFPLVQLLTLSGLSLFLEIILLFFSNFIVYIPGTQWAREKGQYEWLAEQRIDM